MHLLVTIKTMSVTIDRQVLISLVSMLTASIVSSALDGDVTARRMSSCDLRADYEAEIRLGLEEQMDCTSLQASLSAKCWASSELPSV